MLVAERAADRLPPEERPLIPPYALADVEPLAWKRVLGHPSMQEALTQTLKVKWAEATTVPTHSLSQVLEGSDEQFREKVLAA